MKLAEWKARKIFLQKQIINLIGGFPQKKTPLHPRILERTNEGSYFREKIIYETEPGEEVPAYLLIPKKLKSKTPAIFVHHQHGAQFHLGKCEVVGLAGHPDQAYAKELAELGYVILAPDAKCFEERTIFGLEGRGVEYYEGMRLILMGQCFQRRMIWDIIRGIDFLLTRKEVDGNRIGCIGHSLGGQETLFGSVFDSRIKAAVSSCGFSTYKAILRNKVTHNLALYIPGILKYTDFPEIASMIAPRPFLILTGSKDGSFPLDGVQEVYDTARKIYRLYGAEEKLKLVINNIGHGSPDSTREEAYMWLNKWLHDKKN